MIGCFKKNILCSNEKFPAEVRLQMTKRCNQRELYLTLSSLTAAFLSISGFFAAGGLAAGGLSAGAGGGWGCGEADEAANEGVVGSIGLDAEGSLNVRLSTDFCNEQVAHI